MKIDALTLAYLEKAKIRFKALGFYNEHCSYSDVVREAQEMVELLLKAVLRAIGVEVPKIHDVGRVLEKHKESLPLILQERLDKIKMISKRLRKERELSFYGAEDFIPTEEYGPEDAEMAIKDAEFILKTVEELF
ncbi:MAG TPA: HEPN domain-containing protein [Thermoanaerobacterales bacterium]|nr:HEPN domain-containing protein [Thermoanaerobacterales bacterium]